MEEEDDDLAASTRIPWKVNNPAYIYISCFLQGPSTWHTAPCREASQEARDLHKCIRD